MAPIYRSLCVTGEVSNDVIRDAFAHHEIEFVIEPQNGKKYLHFNELTPDLQDLYEMVDRLRKLRFQNVIDTWVYGNGQIPGNGDRFEVEYA
jgi:hypothetical protein